MRLITSAAAAALLFYAATVPAASVAVAQTATPPAPMPAPMAPAVPGAVMPSGTMTPGTMTPGTPAMSQGATNSAVPRTGHKHQTMQQRFDAANVTHDGHLTEAQATAAKWKYVDTHFAAIDKDHKGYVTVDDIHAYAHANRTARHMKPGKPVVPASTN